MIKKLKGKDVNVFIDGEKVELSTSCTIGLTSQTTESATKDDEDSTFDNPEVTQVAWEASTDGLIANRNSLLKYLNKWVGGKTVRVELYEKSGDFGIEGNAFVTNLSVVAAVNDKAKLSVKLTGNGGFLF